MNVGYLTMRKNKWSLDEQAMFLMNIGELLERGYSLAEAVQSTLYYLPFYKQEEIRACIGSLQGGESFYENLIKLQFNVQLISYVFFAEKHGGFATAFQDAGSMMTSRQQTVAKLKKILYYPLFLMAFTAVLFVFVQQILLPKFTALFLSMDLKRNLFMLFIIGAGKIFPILCIILLLLCIALLFYYHLKIKKMDSMTKSRLYTKIPFIGSYFSLYYTHTITQQLSYLLSGGFSIYESLQFFQQNKQQPLYKEVGAFVIEQLKTGERLEIAFEALAFLEKELMRILKHGQENGKLDQELAFFSTFCINTLEKKINKTIKVVQPCLYGFVGLLIISIYLAVLLPMFQLLDGF
ncbi:competence type IV pilus assembly protein ComGB [Niallia sp. NCCP-28]|uniref:competence type IV pilus assembly protein ComGB n=1 Tax=Niallia sp. NCCP-28 TaxID=2934712 RepID=UPI002088EC16|nr:competence type IV pilus assembly protein ComGB [Niallia sp. NCCP-28]GKU81173.1 competence protein ComG [Niallia sp. NCCP-28]